MLSNEYEGVRDLQAILQNFRCDNRGNRVVNSRSSNNLLRSDGLSVSMVSINSIGDLNLARTNKDPTVWSPISSSKK